jgi:hypothetical protein
MPSFQSSSKPFSESYEQSPSKSSTTSFKKPAKSFFTKPRFESIKAIIPLVIIGICIFFAIKGGSYQKPQTQYPVVTYPKDITPVEVTQNRPDNSLPNGTEIIPYTGKGHGELQVSNGTDEDAVLKLVKGQSLVRFVYITKHSSVNLKDVAPGTYLIFFSHGLDWDKYINKFNRNCSYTKFDEVFPYSEEEGYYSIYKITLHPVPDGNAQTSPMDESVFQSIQ